MELIIKIIENISSFDLFYLFITLLSLFKCSKNGFVLSILSASKWLLAYIITLYLFPISKPYVIDLIDNEGGADAIISFNARADWGSIVLVDVGRLDTDDIIIDSGAVVG